MLLFTLKRYSGNKLTKKTYLYELKVYEGENKIRGKHMHIEAVVANK